MSNNKDFKVKNGIQPTVYHEGLGTVVSGSEGSNLSGASYDSVSFNVLSQDANPYGVVFNNDGTKMYMAGEDTRSVYQYSLSTAFNLNTASYDSVSFSVASQDTALRDVAFNNDGTKMYIVGSSNGRVYQYSLSTAFDLSTASYDSVSFSVASQDANPLDMVFNNDGTKMYIVGASNDRVYQYTLSTAFDLSTASYDSVSFSLASQDGRPYGVAFNSDGTKMYMVGRDSSSVNQYTLSTAFDLSTVSYDSVSFSVASQDANPYGVVFNNDITKMYIVAPVSRTIYQYSTALNTAQLDLSTGSVFEITPTSDIQVTLSNPADSGTVSGATLLLNVTGTTAYDLSSVSYDNVKFYVGDQETNPQGAYFNDDGTKMYILGRATDAAYQYTLSTAYDISTASYDNVSLNLSGQDTDPYDIKFNNDGTSMFVTGRANDSVFQYTLSTAYDLSTASYANKSFNFSSQEATPTAVAFNNDGTKMIMAGFTTDKAYQYTLSTAFDVSTASYDSVSIDLRGNYHEEIVFNPDGTRMFTVNYSSLTDAQNAINQYNLSTAFDITTATLAETALITDVTQLRSIEFYPDGKKFILAASTGSYIWQYSSTFVPTITYPSTIEWPGGTAPTSPAIGETDVVTFNTRDGGSTYQGVLAIDGAK